MPEVVWTSVQSLVCPYAPRGGWLGFETQFQRPSSFLPHLSPFLGIGPALSKAGCRTKNLVLEDFNSSWISIATNFEPCLQMQLFRTNLITKLKPWTGGWTFIDQWVTEYWLSIVLKCWIHLSPRRAKEDILQMKSKCVCNCNCTQTHVPVQRIVNIDKRAPPTVTLIYYRWLFLRTSNCFNKIGN